ncbi:MAG: helix-turn-helix domain-containing protein [Bacteroidales bacterium]
MPERIHYINRLILQGEGRHIDFKYEISDARKIARTFVAFANTDGGTLLIGVKDDGTIAGIQSEEEKFMARSAVDLYCRPKIDYSSKTWVINKKVVLEIKIPRGAEQPYMAHTEENKWRAFIRVNDQNILAHRILVKALRRKNSPDGTYITYGDNERKLLEYLEHSDSITLSEYSRIAGIPGKKAEAVLVNFLSLGIITQEMAEHSIVFKLSQGFIENELPI